MASTLTYYNHNHNHNHNRYREEHHNLLHHSYRPASSASSSDSSDSSFSSPAYIPSLSSTNQTLPLPLGAATAGAAAAGLDSLHAQSIPLLSHPPSHAALSSWAEWPAEHQQHRRLGSDTGSGSGIGGASRSASCSTDSTASVARSRRLAAARHHRRHQRSSSSRRMYKPAISSASPPSPLRSTGSRSPGTAEAISATLASAPTSLDAAVAAPGPGAAAPSTASSSSASSSNTNMSGAAPRPSNKRSTDGPTFEDASSASTAAGKLKLPRLERGPDDFSNVVKNRLQSYTRTGQACDRCKVRKIRCDALSEGCSHCINLNLECYVTDRVTGRTERRGYMQQLEREKSGMLSHIRDLERLLCDNGVEVQPWQGAGAAAQQLADDANSVNNPTSSPPTASSWTQSGSVWLKPRSSSSNSSGVTASVSLRPRLIAAQTEGGETSTIDGHDSAALRSIKGTRLTLLDMTIDTANFQAQDVDEPSENSQPVVPLYGRSVLAFFQSSFMVNPVAQPDMPSRHDAFTFCDWYFLVFSPFCPILHKPTILRVVTRIYDEPGFEPCAAELFTLHIMFAMMYHNYGARNWELEGRIHFTALADKHYHFALSKLQEVLRSRDLNAVQALCLLAMYVRGFAKPGFLPLVIDLAMQKAMDLELHRKDATDSKGTNLTKEMRKRVWWSILSLAVFTFGRLGRPMPITAEQFDAEFPEAIADECLSEDGVDPSQTLPCPFEIGLSLHRLTLIAVEMYTHIHSVRCDRQQYPFVVEVLDRKLREWEDSLPDCLKLDGSHHSETVVQGYYTKMYMLETRLCLRHPSAAPVDAKELRDENMRITEATSHEMLILAEEVLKFRALDTTWYHISLFVVCIFSTLAIHWEQRFTLSAERLTRLREEMARWVSIIKDVTFLMGGDLELQFEISRIVDRTIAWIEHDMRGQGAKKTQSSAPSALSQSQGPPLSHSSYDHAQVTATISTAAVPTSNVPEIKGFYQKESISGPTPFPAFSYGSQPQDSTVATRYETGQNLFYTSSTQATVPGAVTVAPAAPSLQVNPLMAFASQASQASQHVGGAGHPGMVWQNRGANWNDWESTVADSQDRYSASTLLTLGAAPRAAVPSNETNIGQAPADMSFIPNSQWPMNLFDGGAEEGPSGGV